MSSPGVEPGPRPSQGRMRSATPRGLRRIVDKQGRKDSNPVRPGWSRSPLPGGRPYQWAPAGWPGARIAIRAEGAGVEPARLIARPLSGRVPSPASGSPSEPGTSSGRRGIRTLTPLRATPLATGPGQPYPAAFRDPARSGRGTRTPIVRPKAGGPTVGRSPKCPAGVEPACPGWKPGASAARPGARPPRTAEGGGVEPPRLIARPLSRRLPSPIGLPFLRTTNRRTRSTGGRNRTCELLLNREVHGPAHAAPVRREVPSGSRTRASALARR